MMIRGEEKTNIRLDVRTKLLVILAVLSLPLLIISLVQLRSYRRNLNEQAAAMAVVESAAAAGALENWIEGRPELVASETPLPPSESETLYARLKRLTSTTTGSAITVFDARQRPVNTASQAPAPQDLQEDVRERGWSDGMTRLTSVRRAGNTGWLVAVGVPLPENTPAGRSIFILAATWALALLASCLLAVWAVSRFTKPLIKLTAAAATLGEGNLQERAEVETSDEVGALAQSFNGMAASLQKKFDDVERQSAFIGEVLDSLPLGVVVLDASLIVRKVNSSFAALTDSDAAHLTGRGLYEAAAGLAVLSEVVEEVRRTRRSFVNYGLPLELSPRDRASRDGQKFWDVIVWPVREQNGERGDLILLLSEVSKRVRAEKLATAAFAAEKSRAAELESVIRQMVEGVVIVDAGGRYRVNPAAARILGREPGEFRDGITAFVVDMALRDMSGRVLPLEETPISRALVRGEQVSGENCKLVRGDGEECVLAVSATPLTSEEGKTIGAVIVFRDITEEVLRHEELVAAYDRLREHDRLKSAFVANMSHELRTPLNVIIGLCQLLERDPQLPLAPLQAEAVVRMERNAHALLDLVNDMLDYSRLEAGRSALRIESVDVAEIINEVADEFTDEAGDKKIKFGIKVSPEIGNVQTDREKLTQVVSCLVSNAVKFTSSGTVAISAAPVGDDKWYIEVSDSGIGMSSDALTYIFDGFRQVDDRLARSYSGVGLGLAITRRIVELLEGEITVESKENEGSRFRITWPRASQPRTGTGSLVGQEGLALVEALKREAKAR
jgi:PAS domain S-box-containing protein